MRVAVDFAVRFEVDLAIAGIQGFMEIGGWFSYGRSILRAYLQIPEVQSEGSSWHSNSELFEARIQRDDK